VEFSVFAESTSKQIKAFRDVYTRIKFACIKTDMEAGRGFVEAIGVAENMKYIIGALPIRPIIGIQEIGNI